MVVENSPPTDGMPPDEWRYTVELLNALDGIDRWLWAETREEAELAEEYLKSVQHKIAEAFEHGVEKNKEYFENRPLSPGELQTIFRSSRDWAEILELGTKASFPRLDFLRLSNVGKVPDLRENVEGVLVVAYLRHSSANRRHQQHQISDYEKDKSTAKHGDMIYDFVITGLSADGLFTAITSAAKGLNTLLIEQDTNAG